MLGTVPKVLGKGILTIGNWRQNQDHSDKSNEEVGQNTEKSPGDLRRLAFT